MSEEKKQTQVICEDEQNLETTDKERESKENKEEIDIEKLKELCMEKICPECPIKDEMQQEVLRVKADADNFRKRMERDKENFCKYATEKVLEDIVPVIDNLELGLEHAKKVEACKDIVEGIEMTLNILLNTLKNHGLEQIKTDIGEPFDPNFHEAMAQQEREDMEPGMVATVMQKGYKIKDRILRPAKVMVSKKQEN
ncbi:nucleotide exchange factor GrpE [Desulfothermus okinawensis JCM 13304]